MRRGELAPPMLLLAPPASSQAPKLGGRGLQAPMEGKVGGGRRALGLKLRIPLREAKRVT